MFETGLLFLGDSVCWHCRRGGWYLLGPGSLLLWCFAWLSWHLHSVGAETSVCRASVDGGSSSVAVSICLVSLLSSLGFAHLHCAGEEWSRERSPSPFDSLLYCLSDSLPDLLRYTRVKRQDGSCYPALAIDEVLKTHDCLAVLVFEASPLLVKTCCASFISEVREREKGTG